MSDSVLIVVADLIFRSKIAETARQVGRTYRFAKSADSAIEQANDARPTLVVVDLDDERVEPFDTIRRFKAEPALSKIHVVGFFSHVHLDVRDRARDAGCDVVLPRSAFVARLAKIVETGSSE